MKCLAMVPISQDHWKPCTREGGGRHGLCRQHEDALYGALLGLEINIEMSPNRLLEEHRAQIALWLQANEDRMRHQQRPHPAETAANRTQQARRA